MSPARILCFFILIFTATPALADGKTMIVLDGSGSMWGQIEGRTKIEIARETLRNVLGTISPETELGLIAYGHREKGSCSDIEVAVDAGTGTAEAIAGFADSINPKGKTPLTEATRIAARALRIEENAATVILVTDGLETCNADPCALGAELEAAGVDFTAHVVGFGLSDEEGQQVACLAEATGGLYLKADDAGQLAEALEKTVAKAPEPEPQPAAVEFNLRAVARLSENGPDMADSNAVRWDFYPLTNGAPEQRAAAGGYDGVFEAKVAAGTYLARARLGRLTVEQEVELNDTETTEVVANFNAGLVRVTPKRTAEGSEADTSARVDVHFGQQKDGGYGFTEVYAGAGEIRVDGRIGKAETSETHTLEAGETLEIDLVIGSGLVVPFAVYAEGGPDVEGGGVRFDVLEAKADLNGKHKSITGQYGTGEKGMDVAPGDYLLHARLGKAEASVPITVKAGERTEATVNLNAGVLAAEAPGAYRIDFLDGKKDIQGKQRKITGSYGESFQETMPPGAYEVLVTYEGDKAEQRKPAEVKAGERSEVSIP